MVIPNSITISRLRGIQFMLPKNHFSIYAEKHLEYIVDQTRCIKSNQNWIETNKIGRVITL